MAIGNRDYVRQLIGGIESDNVSDEDIDRALEYGLSEVYGYTFKNNWATDLAHPLFDKAETTVHYFASSHILDRFSGDGQKADRHRSRAMENAKELKTQYDEYILVNGEDGSGGGGGGTGNSKFSVAIAAYKTWPLNPGVEVQRSPTVIAGD
jgi:hypothetical protein